MCQESMESLASPSSIRERGGGNGNTVTKVFIACTGLGRVNRGFESFTQECFDAIKSSPYLSVRLFKGGGKSQKDTRRMLNFPRDKRVTRWLSQLTNRSPYQLEQDSFFLNLLPFVRYGRPDVIYFSDKNLGDRLWRWRSYSGQSYGLLFSNGGPISPSSFHQWDHIHQVSPIHHELALAKGVSAAKQSLVPYGVKIKRSLDVLSIDDRRALRSRLNLPEDRVIVLSVAAINDSHKRMSYLINEVARLTGTRPYLLLVGQQDSESSAIIRCGNELLGSDNFGVRTVDPHEVNELYGAADIFVLASVSEGSPRALAEAISHGLPCLVHDYEVTRFVLGTYGVYGNFRDEGVLTDLLRNVVDNITTISSCAIERHRFAYDRFSWDRLVTDYVGMLTSCRPANMLRSSTPPFSLK
jgi:1,2-diacylglycerol 3-alpha-glucosyltransferase